jgi:hypothetical protein
MDHTRILLIITVTNQSHQHRIKLQRDYRDKNADIVKTISVAWKIPMKCTGDRKKLET